MLFKTSHKGQIKEMYESFGNLIDEDEFERIYKSATSTRYGFLTVDTDPKQEDARFRSGFHELLKIRTDENENEPSPRS
jgi:hypothetical protein